jgi:hypothetical protein
MKNSKSAERTNFGLTSHQEFYLTEQEKYDNWFWESKAKKKVKEQEKQAQIERMRAETAAMQQILAEDNSSAPTGINVGQVALIGGAVILLGVGAVILLKKKGAKPNVQESLTTEDLMV